jgi:GAF domain-containing protein
MPSDAQIHYDLEDRLRRLNEIGVALSSEQHNLNALLERILQEARRFTRAEAGTLYLAKNESLTFEIIQNDKLQIFVGGSYGKADIPPVALNRESVSGYVAVTGEILNIADVYAEEGQHFEGPRNYDRMTGYHTRSMLVVPMRDHDDQVIGVLQLLNALSPEMEPWLFPPRMWR